MPHPDHGTRSRYLLLAASTTPVAAEKRKEDTAAPKRPFGTCQVRLSVDAIWGRGEKPHSPSDSYSTKCLEYEFSEVQRRCVGMGGPSSPRFVRSTRSSSHPSSSRCAAVTKRISSGLRSSMCFYEIVAPSPLIDPSPCLALRRSSSAMRSSCSLASPGSVIPKARRSFPSLAEFRALHLHEAIPPHRR